MKYELHFKENKMKKLLLLGSILTCVATNAIAKPEFCPFTDYFVINAPAGTTIKSLSSSGNINVNLTGPTNFTTYCKENTIEDGTATLTVSTGTSSCILQIKDGPYVQNPTVSNIDCSGSLRYDAMSHTTGTYTYTLKFQ